MIDTTPLRFRRQRAGHYQAWRADPRQPPEKDHGMIRYNIDRHNHTLWEVTINGIHFCSMDSKQDAQRVAQEHIDGLERLNSKA